ncbi:MAG TPA: serine/threonine-protein kinase [Planctomycetota bacterium]|jgi:serine/threonine protein kinase
MATLTGRTLGGYLIGEELGRGAMGVVFKAKQLSMDRAVALKFLPKRLAQDEKVVARFLREARAAGQLSHPNIVSVHDAGIVEGLHYIAMEYIDGASVQKRLKDKGFFTEKETLDIAAQICEALKLAHGRGILHRDIKPDNFLMDHAGRVRLADLGLARFQNRGDADVTQDGEAMGTPHYMSPEQCKGADVDARSDLYGLGASMFVMATGQTPYDAATAAAVMVKVLTEPHRSLRKLNSRLSPAFVALVEKLMAKDPAKRYSNAQQVLEAIDRCKNATARPVTTPHSRITPAAPLPPSRRLKLVLCGAGAAVLALIVGGIIVAARTPPGSKVAVGPGAKKDAPPIPTPPLKAVPKPEPKPEPPKTDISKIPSVPLPAMLNNETDVLDMKPEHQAAMRKLSVLRRDLTEALLANPDEAIPKIQQFLNDHPNAPPRVKGQIENLLKEAHANKKKLEEDWDAARADVAKEDKKWKAFKILRAFADAHEGSKQTAEAHGMMLTMLPAVLAVARHAAEAGNVDKAEELLDPTGLPNDLATPLKAELEKVQVKGKEIAAKAAGERKHFAALCDKVAGQAHDADSSKRFDFEDAAKALREGAADFKTDSCLADAKALAELYSKAAGVMSKMKTAAGGSRGVELTGLGTFGAGALQGWTDRGLTYKPADLPQSQTVPWKAVTADKLLEVAKALEAIDKTVPADPFSIGALAFAAGAKDAALAAMAKVPEKDASHALAEAAERALKPPPSRDALAKQLYEDALEAKQKKNADAAFKLQQRLVVEFADTTFVLGHLEDIRSLVGSSAKDVATKKDTEPDKKKDVVPDKKKDAPPEKKVEAAALADLKKMNWTEIKGDWIEDPNQRGSFTVKGGGSLFAPVLNGGVQAAFTLEGESSVGVFVRFEPESDAHKALYKEYYANDLYLGQGYGVSTYNASLYIYGDKLPYSPANSVAGKLERAGVPLRIGTRPLTPGMHEIKVVVSPDGLDIWIDKKKLPHSQGKLKPTGGMAINVTGNARIDFPAVLK